MIIHPPSLSQNGDEIVYSSRIELQTPVDNIPDQLWFSFPAAYQNWLNDRLDGFAAGLLLPAMCLGEDLNIRGPISERLLYGLEQYRDIFKIWFSQLYETKISCTLSVSDQNAPPHGVTAAAFSGGVDSFFTLLKNLPASQSLEPYRITHCIMMQGFDVSLAEQGNFDHMIEVYSQTLASIGVELLYCRTNIHAFTAGRLKWEYAHGCSLAAIALVLGAGLRNFFIPSSFCFFRLIPWGSSPVIDHLLSTEDLQIIHHGAGVPRISKLQELSHWPAARDTLRVCINDRKRDGLKNCSTCEKCLRTMTMLKVIGTLSEFRTFRQPFPSIHILCWTPAGEIDGQYAGQIITYACKYKKWKFLPLLYIVSFKGLIYDLLLKFTSKKMFFWLKKTLYQPEKDIFSQTYLDRKTAGKKELFTRSE